MKRNYGDSVAQEVSGRIAAPVADLTELKAIGPDFRVANQLFFKVDDQTLWRFHASSALNGDDLLVAAPGAGSGRFLRCPGGIDIKIPIAFGTADAAVLLTVQAGQAIAVDDLAWEVTADFTGGTGSAIGVHSNKTAPTNWSTKGDLLGGATGDVAATLVASGGIIPGTMGTDMDTVAKRRGLILEPTDTLLFGRITDAFTAGAGFVHVFGKLLRNNGA